VEEADRTWPKVGFALAPDHCTVRNARPCQHSCINGFLFAHIHSPRTCDALVGWLEDR